MTFRLLMLACSFFFAIPLISTELQPWTEVDLMLYRHLDYRFQHFDKVHSSSGSEYYHCNDSFLTAGIYGSYDVWALEAEITAASTHERCFGFDNFTLTGRYQLRNDIIGDPYSIFVGFSYILAPTSAVNDLSTFYHGKNEFLFHISAGKERPCRDTWISRWWAVGLFGIADQGRPWWEAIAAWEKRLSECATFRLYAEGMYGLGKHSLDLDDSFHGYGNIKHRSLDLGARYTKTTRSGSIWYGEVIQRVYAHNYPAYATQVKISFICPFPGTCLVARFYKGDQCDSGCELFGMADR